MITLCGALIAAEEYVTSRWPWAGCSAPMWGEVTF
ncbi:hypothetical protein H4W31_003878 [Plantactinospora soyae]|uniref:Uncharacterized protein n=1 Tax=Plantactinospora soyae TaxID=1544732 RepID=A0A927M7D0_9ACTN|nr:hypothetical protein [Plantactinospora soyae]